MRFDVVEPPPLSEIEEEEYGIPRRVAGKMAEMCAFVMLSTSATENTAS